jgi:hypothetical protein
MSGYENMTKKQLKAAIKARLYHPRTTKKELMISWLMQADEIFKLRNPEVDVGLNRAFDKYLSDAQLLVDDEADENGDSVHDPNLTEEDLDNELKDYFASKCCQKRTCKRCKRLKRERREARRVRDVSEDECASEDKCAKCHRQEGLYGSNVVDGVICQPCHAAEVLHEQSTRIANMIKAVYN